MDDRLGVGTRHQFMSPLLYMAGEFEIIVDFTIKNDGDFTVLVEVWRLASRYVDDRKAAVAETGVLIEIIPMIIRAAMSDDIRHSSQSTDVDRLIVCVMVDAAYSTHNSPIIARRAGQESFPPPFPASQPRAYTFAQLT